MMHDAKVPGINCGQCARDMGWVTDNQNRSAAQIQGHRAVGANIYMPLFGSGICIHHELETLQAQNSNMHSCSYGMRQGIDCNTCLLTHAGPDIRAMHVYMTISRGAQC